ncbi:MAG: trypsin-like peptidase domain-containing protein [Bacteroidetes bacterium]|nr:trypsin-like peptidase domain-containing protein [Bacteroidota bacterium]
MSKRAVLTAIVLVSVGILSGAVLVSSFTGAGLFADSRISFNTEAPFTPSASVAELNKTFSDVAGRVNPQVVFIMVKAEAKQADENPHWFFNIPQPEGDNIQQGSGSGIILTADGYILTNRHVVENAIEDGIKVTLFDNREFDARVVGEDEYTDIAVIKIDANDLSAAALGNSDNVKVGEWVMAVGNPLGFTSTVTAGIVSAISRNIGIMRDRQGLGIENFIQTDAAVNPGNSGGALVNLEGEVIGVNTAIAGGRSGTYVGYSFAVPINLAKAVAQSLIKDGKYERGYIGIRISDIDAKKAEALGMDVFKGVFVESLVDDGAGKAAGVKEGDAIVSVDGKPVEGSNQLQARVGMKHPGETVELKIWRDGKYLTKTVTLKGQNNEDELADAGKDKTIEDKPVDVSKPVTFDKAGFSVKPLTSDAKEAFDIDEGVLVDNVKRNSPAEEARLQKNIVIFEAIRKGQRVSINSVSDFKKFAKSLNNGESVLLRVKLPNKDTAFLPIKAPLE